MLLFCRCPKVAWIREVSPPIALNRICLQTDGHDHVWLALLGLVWFNTRVNQRHQLIKYSLLGYWSATERHGIRESYSDLLYDIFAVDFFGGVAGLKCCFDFGLDLSLKPRNEFHVDI